MSSNSPNKLFLLWLILPCLCLGTANAAVDKVMDGDIHQRATNVGLHGVFSEPNLAVIAESSGRPLESEFNVEARPFFTDDNFKSAMGFIDREKKKTLNYASESDSDGESRGFALRHFGQVLRAVQDFYLQTNYIEIMTESEAYRSDPYNIPLVDWSKVPVGYPQLKSLAAGDAVSPDKNSPIPLLHSKKITDKVTYLQVAEELAVREAQRQWSWLETLIRNRCGTRATNVLAALKQASPEPKREESP